MGRRLVGAVVIVALVACGKKEDKTSAGSAAPPSESNAPPAGATVGSGDATITLPKGVDAAGITVVSKPANELPAAVQPYKETIDKHLKTLKVVELGPDGTKLPASGVVTVTLDPALLGGRPLSDVHAVLVSADGTIEDAPLTLAGTNQVKVEVKHFSWVVFLIAASTVAIAAGMATYLKGASESINRKNCSDWITPDSPKIAELVKDETRFSIDKEGRTITVKPELQGKDVDQGAHMLKADQVLERGYGDCVNLSTVLASALAARGYPVRMVSGGAHYKTTKGKDVQGGHQWAETVIDGKPYYVDTFNAPAIKLVPLHEASAELKLSRVRMCGKDGGSAYNASWYSEHEAPPGDDWVKLEAELADLKDQHKALNKQCIASPTHAACAERKVVYERAKAVQDKLNTIKK